MSTSAAKAAANRANAQHSTGPRTPTGKAASAANSTSHGLTRKRLALTSEDAAEYEAFRDGLAQSSLAPVGHQEQIAFDEYVNSLWRLQRCRRTEPAIFDDCIEALMDADPSVTPDKAMARVFTDPVYQKKLSLFLRYQAAIERAVNRALKELQQLQASRREAEVWAAMRTNTQPPVRAEHPEVASFRSPEPQAIVPVPLEPYPWRDPATSATASH
jgi:hypothetical protein